MSDYSEDCACDVYCSAPEFESATTRKARKEHQCCECKQAINRGDEYVNHFSVCDGYAESRKLCMPCEHLDASISDAGWCPYWGKLAECYHTYLVETGGIIQLDPDEDDAEGEVLNVHNHMTDSARFQNLLDKVTN